MDIKNYNIVPSVENLWSLVLDILKYKHKAGNDASVVTAAIRSVITLIGENPENIPNGITALIEIIQDPNYHRSRPRRYSVQVLGQLCLLYPQYTKKFIKVIIKLSLRDVEQSRFVRKGALIAIGRLGRRWPELVPVTIKYILDVTNPDYTNFTEDDLIGAYKALAKFAQGTPSLIPLVRSVFERAVIRDTPRAAAQALFSLGSMMLSVDAAKAEADRGQYISDKYVEELIEFCELLSKKGSLECSFLIRLRKEYRGDFRVPPPNTKEYDTYFSNAIYCLGFLLRYQPKHFERINTIFESILESENNAICLLCDVCFSYSRIAKFLNLEQRILVKNYLNALLRLNKYDDLTSAASLALVPFCEDLEERQEIIDMLIELTPRRNIYEASVDWYHYYLNTVVRLTVSKHVSNYELSCVGDSLELESGQLNELYKLVQKSCRKDNKPVFI